MNDFECVTEHFSQPDAGEELRLGPRYGPFELFKADEALRFSCGTCRNAPSSWHLSSNLRIGIDANGYTLAIGFRLPFDRYAGLCGDRFRRVLDWNATS
ncbi:MAG: hypothetical protein ACI93T_000399 [Porticoccaceae bacterium]